MSRSLETRLTRLENHRRQRNDPAMVALAREMLQGLLDRIGAAAFAARLERATSPAARRLLALLGGA